MTLVLKVDCRACNRECGDYKHLLDETVIDDESTTLAALLYYCTTLQCFGENHEQGMPEHICNSCVEHLLQSYLFKEMVLQNDRAYRERLQAESQEGEKSVEVLVVEGAQTVEQEIDVGGAEEANIEEILSDNEDNTDGNQKGSKEYEYEEWLEIDEIGSENNDHDTVIQEEIVENEEEIIEKNERDEEENCEYIVNDLEDSDSGGDLRGFKNLKEEIEIENCDMREEVAVSNDDTKQQEVKSSKRRSVKTNGLTEADLTCQYCGKVYDKMCRLREHVYMHTGEKPHVCNICGKKSRTKTHYNVHMLTHSEEKRYKCSICGQNYRTSTSLRVHERKHNNIRPYACDYCDKAFHTAEQRKLHLMLHTGERPFSCTTCGKAYRESHSLKIHMMTHDDVKPYQCEICGKGLTQMSGYRRHMLLHTNEYPYKCDICERPFRISSNLVAHKRLHLDVLPFQCTKCDKGFNNSTRLKRHMLQHEPKEEVFKPRKPRQEAIIVESRVAKSNVVEII